MKDWLGDLEVLHLQAEGPEMPVVKSICYDLRNIGANIVHPSINQKFKNWVVDYISFGLIKWHKNGKHHCKR